jgi:ABC-type multidrug transport system fused ATPase/permease subunit
MHRLSGLFPPDAQETKLRTLIYIVCVLVTVGILSNVFRYIGETMIAHAVLSTLLDLRDRLYEHILRLPMSFFATAPTADLVTRFVQDIQEIQRGFTTLFGKFVREPLRAVFLIGLALALDWRVTVTVALVVPAAVAMFWAVGRSVKKANKKLLQAYGGMISALTASLQNLRVVKAYTAEEQERKRLDDVDRRMFHQQLKLAKLDAFLSPMMETLAVISGSILTVWLASRVLEHSLTLSVFASLSVTLSMVFDPLRKMSDVYVRIQRATAGAERIFQVLDQPHESTGVSGAKVSTLAKSIELSGVTFRYPGAATDALKDVTLTVTRGETVALVGPNGCGKTTLVSLLLRFFDPQSGEVRYDGLNVRLADLKSLRGQFGLVTQEAVIFEGTPLENIAYGSESTNRGRIEDAARRAYAEEFIRNLPGTFDAPIAERGISLSGGQRQRLAIARAIHRDAPILIFDEATSQVDSESELKIQTAIRDFAKNRTTIIIAHRLSTIQFADRIVVMEAGRIIDSGTHRELFDRCALYRTLCQTQMHS